MHPFLESFVQSPSALPSWITDLAQTFPDLLVSFLQPSQAQSLERLQLVQVKVAIVDGAHQHQTPKVRGGVQSRSGVHAEFLHIAGERDLDDGRTMQVSITFYVRGQRKFYRPPLCEPEGTILTTLTSISREHVRDFFASLGQSNSFFVDKELAELNGRPDVIVPSQMTLALLLAASFSTLGTKLEHFTATFYKGINLQATPTIIRNGETIVMVEDNVPIISLICA